MKFSIIVPVYNRVHTIAVCIESIYNTNYNDFEVIAVNDGSTDGSELVLQELATRFPRMRVISQKNQGVSCARNTGIELAEGEYVLFVDSDDALGADALSILDSVGNESADLIVYLSTKVEYNKTLPKIATNGQNETLFIKDRDKVVEWLFTDYMPYKRPIYSLCTKAFKLSLIKKHNIRLRNDISLGEDQVFVCTYLQFVNTMYYVGKTMYYLLSWPKDKRNGGLGTCFRTPQDFLYNQVANYRALVTLHKETGVRAVKEYAVNYILDRPITRILYRHLNKKNKQRVSFLKLWWFLIREIVPVMRAEFDNAKMLRDAQIAKFVKMLRNKQYFRLLRKIHKKVNQ